MAHLDYPVFVDISIVKSSSFVKGAGNNNRRVFIPQYTVQDAKVFTNQEEYEVELELDNSRVGPGTPFDTTAKIMTALRKCIRIVFS